MQFHLNQAVEVLAQTPDVLNAMLRRKSAGWLNCRRTPESFSQIDVLGHLIHAEMTDWIPRLRMILETQDGRAFDPFDRFAFQTIVAGRSIGELLDEFAQLRRQSLETFRDLGIEESQFGLPGLHPDLGPVTLENLLATWVVHDLGHIAQVVKTMAGEYRDAVGPWRAYITILD